jgi:flagellar biogenesis protein FliO
MFFFLSLHYYYKLVYTNCNSGLLLVVALFCFLAWVSRHFKGVRLPVPSSTRSSATSW